MQCNPVAVLVQIHHSSEDVRQIASNLQRITEIPTQKWAWFGPVRFMTLSNHRSDQFCDSVLRWLKMYPIWVSFLIKPAVIKHLKYCTMRFKMCIKMWRLHALSCPWITDISYKIIKHIAAILDTALPGWYVRRISYPRMKYPPPAFSPVNLCGEIDVSL